MEQSTAPNPTPRRIFIHPVIVTMVCALLSSTISTILVINSLKNNNRHATACKLALAVVTYKAILYYVVQPDSISAWLAYNFLWGLGLSVFVFQNKIGHKVYGPEELVYGLLSGLGLWWATTTPKETYFGDDLSLIMLFLQSSMLTFFLFSSTAPKGFYHACIIIYVLVAFFAIFPENADGDYYIDKNDDCPYAPSAFNYGCPSVSWGIPYPKMIFVNGGSFNMGSNSGYYTERPIHKVTLNSFYIGQIEVTEAQWLFVMGKDTSDEYVCESCPVLNVSWDTVQVFIRKLNEKTGKKYRLPTEAEWEFAARGGIKSRNRIYAGSNNINRVAWYAFDGKDKDGFNRESRSGLQEVGRKQANELGIYDLSGNVEEWCQDGFDLYTHKAVKNPFGKGKNRGSYLGGKDYATVSSRGRLPSNYWDWKIGFRLAMDFVPTKK